MSHNADYDAAVAKRRAQVKALYLIDAASTENQFGVVLDDAGSVDMFDTYQEAKDAYVAYGGLALLRIRTETFHFQEKCERDVGERPGWMSPGQYDPSPCVLDIGHDGDHEGSRARPTPPATPDCTCSAGNDAGFAAQHATLCPRFAHPCVFPPGDAT